eukprot:TRINITY_DN11261_c0_g1_i3.p1 TRINITY_DN11261_c0_g1~~TRINITY_DN11261_c0_g1_i3.p1  ORF type:complete len:540 (+),score=93.19 TRINITY_DN11261_c0_g1_i3:1016-2635(+)
MPPPEPPPEAGLEKYQTALTVIGSLNAALVLIFFSWALWWFSKLRTDPMIRARGFWTAVLPIAFLSASGIWGNLGMVVIFKFTCRLYFIMLYMFGNAAVAFLIERGILLYVHSRIAAFAKLYGERIFGKAHEMTNTTSNVSSEGEFRTRRHSSTPNASQSPLGGGDDDDEELVIFGSRGMRISSWLFNHRSWFHHGLVSKSKLATTFLVLAMSVPVFLTFYVWDSDTSFSSSASESCHSATTYISRYSLGLSVFLLILLVIAGRTVSKIEENFRIKEELNYGKILLMLVAMYRIFQLSNLLTQAQTLIAGAFVLQTFVPLCAVYISFYNVAKHARRNQEALTALGEPETHLPNGVPKGNAKTAISTTRSAEAEAEGSHWDETLSNPHANLNDKLIIVLDHPALLERFTAFLTQEFSVENVLFVIAVRSFTRTYPELSREQRHKLAKKIFKEFCAADARLQINISHDSSKSLRLLFNDAVANNNNLHHHADIEVDIFQNAYEQIMQLMCTDSLPRFLLSEDFSKLVQEQTKFVQDVIRDD